MYKLLLRVCEVQLPSIVWFRQMYCSICCNKKFITPCWEWPQISWYLTLYAVSVVLFSDTLFYFFGNVDSHTSGNVQVLVIAFIYIEVFANANPFIFEISTLWMPQVSLAFYFCVDFIMFSQDYSMWRNELNCCWVKVVDWLEQDFSLWTLEFWVLPFSISRFFPELWLFVAIL